MSERFPNVLVVGRAKTGTTIISKTIQHSMPDAKYRLEPKDVTFFQNPEMVTSQEPIVVKILYEHWDGRPNLRWAILRNELPLTFERIVLIKRDPRDEIISRLFYSTYAFFRRNGYDAHIATVWRDFVRQKEETPEAVSFRDMIEKWKSLTGVDVLQAIRGAQRYARFLSEMPDTAFILRYEDFIAGDLTRLEQYLGLSLTDKRDVGVVQRTSRSNASNNWKRMFLPSDIPYLRERLDKVMHLLGYEDWTLDETPRLDPSHGSLYLDRIIDEVRAKLDAETAERGQTPATTVLLIRRSPAPTDCIYAEGPLAQLEAEGVIQLDTLNTDDFTSLRMLLKSRLPQIGHIVISRSIPYKWIELIERYRSEKTNIVYLFDDDFEAAGRTNGIPVDYARRLDRVLRTEFPRLCRLADRVVVTSSELARRYDRLSPEIMSPNVYLPEATLDHHEEPDRIRIVYFGTGVHNRDLAMVSDALQEIHDEFSQVDILVTGKEFPGKLAGLPRVQCIRQLSWPRFREFLSNRRDHIALAPLMETPFNTAKSCIKFAEACIVGAAGIYSRLEPYETTVQHDYNGLLVDNSSTAWREALQRLVLDHAHRRALAHNAQVLADNTLSVRHAVAAWRTLITR